MRRLRILSIPAALALMIIGSTAAPGTQSLSPIRSKPAAAGPGLQRAAAMDTACGSPPISGPNGDFNGDTFADLAVGAPFEDAGGKADGGGVNVIYGSQTGLVNAGNQQWDQDSEGIGEAVESSDQFGFAAVAGDFNDDGFSDLGVGVPLEDAPGDSGVVNVIYGSAAGLASAGNQVWSQNSAGIGDGREAEDNFGRALAAADFNGDRACDLAIGVPFEDVSGRNDAGAVNVIYGSPSGLTAPGSQFWNQNSAGIAGAVELGDLFGWAVTAADFDGDSFDDLAVAVTQEDPSNDSGGVNVIYGSAAGLTAAGNQFWSQNSPGIGGSSESEDLFGYSVAGGDFDDDGFADLVVGVPFEDVGKKANAGAVNVIYGSAAGLTSAGNQVWSQDGPGIIGTAEARDELGFALATEDFNDDGVSDLAIGVPAEDAPTNTGAIALIFGGPGGLSAVGNEGWSQAALGGNPEAWDGFGFSLAAGRFGNGTAADLAIGVPFEDVGAKVDAGAVNVAYGSPGGLDPATRQFWTQDALDRLAERADRFGFAGGGHQAG